MAERSTARTIDEYIAEFPTEVRERLEVIRALVRELAPDAVETISYAIPTFDLAGTHLVHFAGHARHVGLYPMPSGMEAFSEELARYKAGKGSVRFSHDEPLPTDLIRRIVSFRVGEVRGAGRG